LCIFNGIVIKLIGFYQFWILIFLICFFSGFSLGDELGFPESLGNTEANKRRSLNLKPGANSIGVLPASKQPVSIWSGRSKASKNAPRERSDAFHAYRIPDIAQHTVIHNKTENMF
jgi:hypothetical protein